MQLNILQCSAVHYIAVQCVKVKGSHIRARQLVTSHPPHRGQAPNCTVLTCAQHGTVLISQYCTLYSIHCTLYTAQCTLLTVHCTLYTVHCTLYNVHCRVYFTPAAGASGAGHKSSDTMGGGSQVVARVTPLRTGVVAVKCHQVYWCTTRYTGVPPGILVEWH